MCCIPIKCLRAIIFFGSLCAIAISIALLGLTIYVQVSKRQIISAANQGVVTGSLITLYLSSIIFLLLGLSGLSGSMKRTSKKGNDSGGCLLALFSLGVIIFFVVFLLAAIFFFIGPEIIFGTDCTQGSKTSLVKDIFTTSTEAYSSFCNSTCPCTIHDQNSDLYKIIANKNGTIQSNRSLKYGDCPNVESSTSVEILAALQNLLQCGGWCPIDIDLPAFGVYTYRFRNINDCITLDCLKALPNCYDQFKKFMTVEGKTVGYGCICALLVCLLNIIAVCCICCHPSKGKKGSNFYSRMIQMD